MSGADVANRRLAAFEALVEALTKVPAADLVAALVKVSEETRKVGLTRHAASNLECASVALEQAAAYLAGHDRALLQNATNIAVRFGARLAAGAKGGRT